MKLVYSVLVDIQNKPDDVLAAQKLTLDRKRPQGLNGTYGLYGSKEWVENLLSGKIPQRRVNGVIQRAYKVGMYESDDANTIEFITDEGILLNKGIYVNDERDSELFLVGKRVEIIYFIEDLKSKDAITGEYNKYEFVYQVLIGT